MVRLPEEGKSSSIVSAKIYTRALLELGFLVLGGFSFFLPRRTERRYELCCSVEEPQNLSETFQYLWVEVHCYHLPSMGRVAC